MTITIIFIFMFVHRTAPNIKEFVILKAETINPYESIWEAVCEVESKNDPTAYNEKENAVGIAQIRPIRIRDYNERTGKNYSLDEMYDPVKSKEVFMYFAQKLQNPSRIIRKWNGSGPMTLIYMEKVLIEMNRK